MSTYTKLVLYLFQGFRGICDIFKVCLRNENFFEFNVFNVKILCNELFDLLDNE